MFPIAEEMCSIALELLWKKINNPYFTVRQTISVAGDLMVRQSTGPARETSIRPEMEP